MGKKLLRYIPPVHELLNQDEIKNLVDDYNRELVVEEINIQQEELRRELLSDVFNFSGDISVDIGVGIQSEDQEVLSEKNYRQILESLLIERVKNGLSQRTAERIKKVINATGTVIHTNMGRAPLAPEVCDELSEISRGYNNLELDLETGERGSRYTHIEDLITKLTGAEAALVVNNNAAAVMLVLNNLAKGKEVILSRGELVEIGGSFRVPDVMKQSGAILKEVGTTNKTHLKDYEEAINEETAMLLSVHTSNYRIIGFTEKPALDEMAKLARDNELPLVKDLGSGLLYKLEGYDEPTVNEVMSMGVDIATFSGDKLLGGPQSGIIVGKKEYIESLKKDQLTRALRMDKLTMKALETTLRLYLDFDKAKDKIPVLAALTAPLHELEAKANEIAAKLKEVLSDDFEIEVEPETSRVGGGAMPEVELPTKVVALKSSEETLEKLNENLRHNDPPIMLRFKKEKLLIDPRSLLEDDSEKLINAISQLTN
ncbi:L-seryl-tRNA(Sec) selenium transferase [Natranaerofaba carboxydovora]|uniref:L-seryl-tRNA(Sec) selenium transferase n=1 Tax=Natranaerofaba carboxydovora TaxID=2742683 RepID=UPI001F130B94|nr:L-seryl-tRNA(Sec) selenium transferase [Natranaerofaba carboxydovora]UMZ73054.1 L-seryl-tRNA(Sec) selenium transferase [Natranaerofaba carboxydovora]